MSGNQHSTPVQQQQQQQAGQPVEFNHAINYVNKIKVHYHVYINSHVNNGMYLVAPGALSQKKT